MRTRFAPSPTGPLHLGHVAAMIHVWGLAQCTGATVDVRIEDHDRQRCRAEYIASVRTDLEWLGFVPARGGRWSLQSGQDERYHAALDRLHGQGMIYACRCSRRDSEPAAGGNERRYPGRCRELQLPYEPGTCLRVRLPDEDVCFHDGRHGPQSQRPAAQCGDLVLRDRHGNWTYQFAVVVDDWLDEIDWIIRGDDLLASTGRQLLLARLLGRQQPLQFVHHPLIVGPDGAKLSKREGAAPVGELRRRGVLPAEVIGQAAHRCGLLETARALTVEELSDIVGAPPLLGDASRWE